jgi:hypothetical protein
MGGSVVDAAIAGQTVASAGPRHRWQDGKGTNDAAAAMFEASIP